MSAIALQVDRLGKAYQIAGERRAAGYRTLQEELLALPRRLAARAPTERFWALREVSFELREGEALGIIGRNGAGKSTLLKILARVTEPTEGAADIYGRVGSMLEVGSGFHPELTGRENIFLNGAILGMRRDEIRRRFDEIVAFAEVEQFIDTPVKRYSSGMYMRLAFAVAAHLEPELLIIDEVLAVGDAAFQKKSLGKMGEMARSGRTLLFVSHQMSAVQSLCSRCLWLDEGRVVADGEPRAIIARYLSHSTERGAWRISPAQRQRLQNPYFTPTALRLVGRDLAPLDHEPGVDEPFGLLFEGEIAQRHPSLNVGAAIYADSGELICWLLSTDEEEARWPPLALGPNRLVAWLPPFFLNEGAYRIELIVSLHSQQWLCRPMVNAPAISLSVRGGLGHSPYWLYARPGLTAPRIPFEALGPATEATE
jgi:lipopolysaccharide transport system ATP-binding protein